VYSGEKLMINKFDKLLFLFLVMCFVLSGCQKSEEDIYETGKRYFRAGDYTKAEEYFRQTLEKNPDAAELPFFLAVTYHKNKNYEKALINYQRILDSDYESELLSNKDFMAKIFHEYKLLVIEYAYSEGVKGNFEKAEELLWLVIEDMAYLNFHMGKIAVIRKEFRKARGHFQTAAVARNREGLREDVEFSILLRYNMANLFYSQYEATRDEQDLLNSFRELRLANNFSLENVINNETRQKIAEFYDKVKDMPAYIKTYGEVDKFYDRVRIFERGEEWEKMIEAAKEVYEKSEVKDDKFYSSVKIGDGYVYLKDKENALKYYRQALQIGKTMPDLFLHEFEERVISNLEKIGVDVFEGAFGKE